MKKILSVLVVCALLLATLGITASAAAFFDYGNLNARVTVKKSNAVVIDGKITPGEYEEYTDGYTEWYVAENASDYFGIAEEMAKTAKWYFSWDGKYLNIAAKWNAQVGAEQEYPGGYIYSDKTMNQDPSYVHCDDFLAYGASINLISAEISPDDEAWTRLYYVVGENTATGEKIHGTYSSQNGQNMDYIAAESDFDFTFDGTWATAEYRVPIIELCESFKENAGNQMFKASITLQGGVATSENGEDVDGTGVNTLSWGVRLGQFGYNSDSGNLDKVHATFRLVDEVIEGPVDTTPDDTTPDDTTPDDTTPDDTTPDDTTPGETTPGETTPGETTPGETTPGETTPGETTPGETTPDDKPVAPPTGDIMVVAAALSAISACGVMIAKKRR